MHIDGEPYPIRPWASIIRTSLLPFVGRPGMRWLEGQTIAGALGIFNLPLITAGTLQPVSMTSITTISFRFGDREQSALGRVDHHSVPRLALVATMTRVVKWESARAHQIVAWPCPRLELPS